MEKIQKGRMETLEWTKHKLRCNLVGHQAVPIIWGVSYWQNRLSRSLKWEIWGKKGHFEKKIIAGVQSSAQFYKWACVTVCCTGVVKIDFCGNSLLWCNPTRLQVSVPSIHCFAPHITLKTFRNCNFFSGFYLLEFVVLCFY